MTTRKLYCYGLIAGLKYSEMKRLEPSFIMDAYAQRIQYDVKLASPMAARRMGLI